MSKNDEYGVRGTVLDVPFKDKDQAKELGARWDADMRKWFVPKGLDLEPFSQWIKSSPTTGASI